MVFFAEQMAREVAMDAVKGVTGIGAARELAACSDFTQVPVLDEPTMLNVIKDRYEKDVIYVRVMIMLICVCALRG